MVHPVSGLLCRIQYVSQTSIMLTMLRIGYKKQKDSSMYIQSETHVRMYYQRLVLPIVTLLVMELHVYNKQTLCMFIDILVVASIV